MWYEEDGKFSGLVNAPNCLVVHGELADEKGRNISSSLERMIIMMMMLMSIYPIHPPRWRLLFNVKSEKTIFLMLIMIIIVVKIWKMICGCTGRWSGLVFFLGSSSSSPSPSTIEFAPSKNPKTMWNVREHPLYSFKNAICFFYSLQKNTDFDLNCFSEGEEADSQNPIHAHIMSGLESSAIFTERTTDIVHSSQKRIVFSSR